MDGDGELKMVTDCGPVDGDGLISIWNCGEFVRLWVEGAGSGSGEGEEQGRLKYQVEMLGLKKLTRFFLYL